MKKPLKMLLFAFLLVHGGLAQGQKSPALAQNNKLPVPTPQENRKPAPDQRDASCKLPPWWETPEGWLAVLGVPTLVLLYWQAKKTHHAADAARKSADAATDAVEVARNTAERQLRAYLLISHSELRFHEDGTWEPVLRLKNCGQTPAYKVTGISKGRIREYPLTHPLEPFDPNALKAVAVIPPGHHHEIALGRFSFPLPVIQSLSGKKMAFYIYGETTYVDVFNKTRTLRFQLIHGGPAGTRTVSDNEGRQTGMFSMDTEGNEAD